MSERDTHQACSELELRRAAIEEVLWMLRAIQAARAERSPWFVRVERRSTTWGLRNPALARRV